MHHIREIVVKERHGFSFNLSAVQNISPTLKDIIPGSDM